MVWQFRSLGRVIAVGQPGEHLPQIGAERGYLPLDDWKDTVSNLIQGTRSDHDRSSNAQHGMGIHRSCAHDLPRSNPLAHL